MKIEEIRVYAEVLEQGLDFKEYLIKAGFNGEIHNVYTKKSREEITSKDSLTDRIRKCKDVDVLLTAIIGDNEFPLLMVEYSTAVPTDDHKMQRSDVYFWSSVFKVPMLKIYPTNKGMDQQFGGGDKFTDEMEEVLAFRKGGLFYPVNWRTIKGLDTLETKKNALSCIYYSEEIFDLIKTILLSFKQSSNYSDYFIFLRKDYETKHKSILLKYKDNDLTSIIVNSTRFNWANNKLISKINRFGHAMDPDRGVLYFTNMLIGASRCITEIQVNRPDDIKARGGYGSLFDSTAQESCLLNYVKNIIQNKNNIFSVDDALFILKKALNIESYDIFKKVSKTSFIINDNDLLMFLKNNPSMTSKCIFFLSTKLILTDKTRKEICSIEWNELPIQKYFSTLYTFNYKKTKIVELSLQDAKEDIITFASVELYKKIFCDLLAVSYPGAQGDRCILAGEGRTALRDYIDIIAYKIEGNSVIVFLEECKDDMKNTPSDAKKLNEIISNPIKQAGLLKLFTKTTGHTKIDKTKISIGSKITNNIPSLDVDYIFMFDILNNDPHYTIIKYSVALIDMSLAEIFKPLLNELKLKGQMKFDKIYRIA